MMRAGAAAAGGALLLAACTAAPPFLDPAERSAAIGKTRAEIAARFGAPTHAVAADSEERLIYVYDKLVLYGPSGPAAANRYYCRVTFQLQQDRVTAVAAEGADCSGG